MIRQQDTILPADVGAGALAEALQRQGVQTVFGICGHLDLFFGGLEDLGIRLVGMRHEAAVVHAADGYARTRRQTGVCVVTAGPGSTNAVGGIGAAWEACTPLVVIAGRNALNLQEMSALQELDASGLVRPLVKWSAVVHDASRLPEYVDRAFRIAREGRPGPVLLEVPSDLMFVPRDPEREAPWLGPVTQPTAPHAAPAVLDDLAARFTAARQPLIIAGSGAAWSGAGPVLQRLAALGIPVMGKSQGRGLVAEDLEQGFPWSLAQIAAPRADLVLLAGTRINATLSYGNQHRFDWDATLVQIDLDPAELGRNRPVDVPILADVRATLEGLADRLEAAGTRFSSAWVRPELEARLAALAREGQHTSGLVHPIQAGRALADRLPEDAVLVGDGAACLNWFNATLKLGPGQTWMDHSPFGQMGIGVPFAIGAAAAEQDRQKAGEGDARPVVLVSGDGSFGFYLAELATASWEHLPFLAVIANDGAWGANRVNQKRNLGRNYGTHLSPTRYDRAAVALECEGIHVDEPGGLDDALDRGMAALAAGRTVVIDVACDPEVPERLRDEPLVALGGATGNLRRPVSR